MAVSTVVTDPEVRRELVATVRRFVAREVLPVASEFEHADMYPEAIVEQMKALGLFGIAIPEDYGGLGLDLLTYIGVIEELAYGWMSLSGIVNTHTIAAHLVVHHGTDVQKQRWLPRLATGELRGCLSLSEADAGSDTRNIVVPSDARRRRIRRRRHEVLGHQRRTRRLGRARPCAPKRASRASWSRRNPARRVAA